MRDFICAIAICGDKSHIPREQKATENQHCASCKHIARCFQTKRRLPALLEIAANSTWCLLCGGARAATFFIHSSSSTLAQIVYTHLPCAMAARADYTKSVMQRERRRAINHGRKMSLSLSWLCVCEIIARRAISDNTRGNHLVSFCCMRPSAQSSPPNNGSRSAQNTRAPLSALCMRYAHHAAMEYQQQNTGTARHFDGGRRRIHLPHMPKNLSQ
jgi:hypothetical protein